MVKLLIVASVHLDSETSKLQTSTTVPHPFPTMSRHCCPNRRSFKVVQISMMITNGGEYDDTERAPRKETLHPTG